MRVSTIIPAYNSAEWIAQAVRSVKEQTRPSDQIIVVDDASTDATAEIAEASGAEVIRMPRNGGSAAARNKGVAHASGDVIALLDSDDYWAPNHLEVLTSLFEAHPEASVACAAVQRFGQRNETITGYAPEGQPGNVFWEAARTWVHVPTGMAIRRDALLSVGGFCEDFRLADDYDIMLKLSYRHLFVASREVTSYWRWHGAQLSQRKGEQLREVYAIRQRFLGEGLVDARPKDANRFRRIMREKWRDDLTNAIKTEDWATARIILLAHDLVPNLSPAYPESAALVSRLGDSGQDDAATLEPVFAVVREVIKLEARTERRRKTRGKTAGTHGKEVSALRADLAALKNSTSWKITRPLRFLSRKLRIR